MVKPITYDINYSYRYKTGIHRTSLLHIDLSVLKLEGGAEHSTLLD